MRNVLDKDQSIDRSTRVDIRKLKIFALEKLPKDWPLREVLLAERDELETSELVAKMEIWLRLMRSGKV